MKEVIGDFIKMAIGVESPNTDFQKLMKVVREEIGVDSKDEDDLAHIISALFYHDNKYVADNIGLPMISGSLFML